MPHASAAQTVLPLGDQPEEASGWDQVLRAAFADPDRASGFLWQAEAAVRAHPGNGLILLLAATAALLDQNPERAQVFLKRFSKRYAAITPYHLLRALALAEENKLGSARSMLDAHGLTSRFDTLLEDLIRVQGAWHDCQTSRDRDAIYGYLSGVFNLVSWWAAEDRAVGRARWALRLHGLDLRTTDDPFAMVIFCTSDLGKVDKRTRSKWSRMMRFAAEYKRDDERLDQFIKRRGGINKCVEGFTRRFGRPRPKQDEFA